MSLSDYWLKEAEKYATKIRESLSKGDKEQAKKYAKEMEDAVSVALDEVDFEIRKK